MQEGEALRDDDRFAHVSVWEHKGEDAEPERESDQSNAVMITSVVVIVPLPPADVSADFTPEELAEALRTYATAGVDHLQLVLDPITIRSVELAGRALDLLD